MSLALIAMLPFLGALFPGLMIRAGREACAATAFMFSALALLGITLHIPALLRGEVVTAQFAWLPQLGLNAHFMLDGLGLLFALLILGIGLLIIVYARYYLSKSDPMGQFFTYLMLFQGAMLGIVLSDNILLLLVFWELTSLSSFLLIGFWKHLPDGRQGARMALTITGLGGLSMIAGMLILGQIAGSYDLSVILTQRAAIQASDWYLPALLLILLGAFTKSAQFPFHFWLPHAMAAPTPVSAYLHSATMVKAGLFLMARMWPVLAGTPEWFWVVTSAGLITMVMAAKIALFKDDLKALLAYSTVSQLGLITMLLGFGTPAAASVAVFHIINHALFKAALFMTAGIVDHETHTRDIRRLGGLAHLMPITFTIATLAALSMAGVPPLNGFLSKEMMLEQAAHIGRYGPDWLLPTLVTIGAAFSVAYALRYISHTFLGQSRSPLHHPPHDPGAGLWLSPAVLTALVVAIGLMPLTVAGWLVDLAAAAVTGQPAHVKILHWHGLQAPALWMSLAAIGGGLAVLGTHSRLAVLWAAAPRPDARTIFDAFMALLIRATRSATDRLHNGAMPRQLAIATLVIVVAGYAAFRMGGHLPGTRVATPVAVVPVIGWLLLVAASFAIILLHHQRLLTLMMLGIVGLIVSVSFAYLSAPDLALTQIAVEVVTVILLLLALHFLPKQTQADSRMMTRLRDATIATLAGLAIAGLSYAMMMRDFAYPSIAQYHIENAKSGAGGTNVVNVILVDFRGYDTFGEITVLGIAGLVIFALIESVLRAEGVSARLAAMRPVTARAGDRHPMMLVVATRVLLPIALMVGVYIFLRGHNLPGGGFIAGLVVAIALLMQYMASGFAWTAARKTISYHGLIGAGIIIAATTGMGAWLVGLPFLTSGFAYIHLPPLEEFELATAALFDLGVFLCVLGAVMLAMSSLSRLALQTGESINTAAFDIDPTATSHNQPAPAPQESASWKP